MEKSLPHQKDSDNARSIILEAAFNAIEDGIGVINVDGFTLNEVNAAFTRIFDEPYARLKNTPVHELAQDKKLLKKKLTEFSDNLPTAESIFFKIPMKRHGVEFPALIRLNSITSGGQQSMETILLVLTDVTRLVNRERSLSELESRYRLLFDSSNDPILVIDMKTEAIIEANRAAANQTGYEANQLVGKHFDELTPPSTRYLEREGLSQLYANGNILFESTFLTRDNREIPVQISMALTHLAGKIVIVASFRDISQQKELELERTEIAKLDAVRKIAGGIAHEISQPLQSLVYIADIIGHEKLDSKKTKDLVVNIPMLVKRMDDLLKKMHSIVRLETKTYTDQVDILDIGKSTDVES